MVCLEWEVAYRASLIAWFLYLIGKSDIDPPLYARPSIFEASRIDQQQ
jgi:hypothetical protein